MLTLWKALATNHKTGEDYPVVLITDGTRSRAGNWRLSSKSRVNQLCELIKQAGGKPQDIQVRVNTEGGTVPLDSPLLIEHLTREKQGGTKAQGGLPNGVRVE